MPMKRRTRNLILRAYLPLALLIGLISALIWGNWQKRSALRYERQIEDQHAQSYNDLSDKLSLIETLLSKLTVSASKDQAMLLLSELWRATGESVATTAQIPSSYGADGDLSAFLIQVGDYAHSRLRGLAQGEDLNQEDRSQITDLQQTVSELSGDLQEAWERGNAIFSFPSLDSEVKNALIDIESLDENDPYPQQIYDSPAAKEVARIFLSDILEGDIEEKGEENGSIAAFLFEGKSADDKRIEIAVRKKAGSVLWMRLYDEEENPQYELPTPERCESLASIGQSYLREKGYDSMEGRFWKVQDGSIMISYVFVQDGVMIYSDQIKLLIKADTGRIVGFDAEGFLFSQHQRPTLSAAITAQEAQERLAPHLEVKEIKRALIPINASEERLCYEFFCSYQQQDFFIYINANNGREEKILKFLDTSDGKLLI